MFTIDEEMSAQGLAMMNVTHEVPKSPERWDSRLFATLHDFGVSDVVRGDEYDCKKMSTRVN